MANIQELAPLIRENNHFSSNLSANGGKMSEIMWASTENDNTKERDLAIAFYEIGMDYLPDIQIDEPKKDYTNIYKIIQTNVLLPLAESINKISTFALSEFKETICSPLKIQIDYQTKFKDKKLFQSKKLNLLEKRLSSLYILIKELKGLPIKDYDYNLYYNEDVLTDEHLEKMDNNNRNVPIIRLILIEKVSKKKDSNSSEKKKTDNTLNSIIEGFGNIYIPKYNQSEAKQINISIINVDRQIAITCYMIYWGLHIIYGNRQYKNKQIISHFQLIDCIKSLSCCLNSYSEILSINTKLDLEIVLNELERIYAAIHLIDNPIEIKKKIMLSISTNYPSLLNSSTFDLSTKKNGIELYEEQKQVMSIIYSELTKETEATTPPTPGESALYKCTVSPALIWYKVPPSGGKTILSISLSSMISKNFAKCNKVNKQLLYICYNTLVRLSVANAAKLAGMPFWIASSSGPITDLQYDLDVPYTGRRNGRHCHIPKMESYSITEKYIEYEKNTDLWPAEIIITDIESAVELIKNFPNKFVVYLDEPTAGAENGIGAGIDESGNIIGENRIQKLNAEIIKASINTQLIMLSSTLPELEAMPKLNELFPNSYIVQNNRIPVGCQIIDPNFNEILPIQLADDLHQFRIIISNTDSKYTKYYTFDKIVIIAAAIEAAALIALPHELLFQNYFNNLSQLSSKLIQNYIIDLFSYLNELSDQDLTHYMHVIFEALYANSKTITIKNIIKEGKVLLVGVRRQLDSCIDYILEECNIDHSKLGDELVAKLKEFDQQKNEYDKAQIRYEKANKSEKENMEIPICPEFVWNKKIGNSYVKLTDVELKLLANNIAGLLLSGAGKYDPMDPQLIQNISMREITNGNLAALFSTQEITYGTNMPLISIFIDSSYGHYATPNSLYQLIGRAGRTGKSEKANAIFNDVITMKKTILPPELIYGEISNNFETLIMNFFINL